MPLFTGSLRVFVVAAAACLGGFGVSRSMEDAGLSRLLWTAALYSVKVGLSLLVPQVRRDVAMVASMFRSIFRRPQG